MPQKLTRYYHIADNDEKIDIGDLFTSIWDERIFSNVIIDEESWRLLKIAVDKCESQRFAVVSVIENKAIHHLFQPSLPSSASDDEVKALENIYKDISLPTRSVVRSEKKLTGVVHQALFEGRQSRVQIIKILNKNYNSEDYLLQKNLLTKGVTMGLSMTIQVNKKEKKLNMIIIGRSTMQFKVFPLNARAQLLFFVYNRTMNPIGMFKRGAYPSVFIEIERSIPTEILRSLSEATVKALLNEFSDYMINYGYNNYLPPYETLWEEIRHSKEKIAHLLLESIYVVIGLDQVKPGDEEVWNKQDPDYVIVQKCINFAKELGITLNLNHIPPKYAVNNQALPALFLAIKKDNFDIVAALVENGARIENFEIQDEKEKIYKPIDVLAYAKSQPIPNNNIINYLQMCITLKKSITSYHKEWQDISEIKKLLADANKILFLTKPIGGLTPLALAIEHDQFEIAELLFDFKIDVNERFGFPPMNALSLAIPKKNIDMIILLLKNGATFDQALLEKHASKELINSLLTTWKNNSQALDTKIDNRNFIRNFKNLLPEPMQIKINLFTQLQHALKNKKIGDIYLALEKAQSREYDSIKKEIINYVVSQGNVDISLLNPIYLSIVERDNRQETLELELNDILKKLLNSRALKDYKSIYYIAKTLKTTKKIEGQLIQYFLDDLKRSRSENIKDFNKYFGYLIYEESMKPYLENTPLIELGIRTYDSDIVKILIQHKVNINVKHELYDTPLISAVKKGDIFILKQLLQAGADPNLESPSRGITPLAYALCYRASLDIIKALINANANLNKVNYRECLQNFDTHPQSREVISLLLQKRLQQNGDFLHQDYEIYEWTMLNFNVRDLDKYAFTRSLLQRGADPNKICLFSLDHEIGQLVKNFSDLHGLFQNLFSSKKPTCSIKYHLENKELQRMSDQIKQNFLIKMTNKYEPQGFTQLIKSAQIILRDAKEPSFIHGVLVQQIFLHILQKENAFFEASLAKRKENVLMQLKEKYPQYVNFKNGDGKTLIDILQALAKNSPKKHVPYGMYAAILVKGPQEQNEQLLSVSQRRLA